MNSLLDNAVQSLQLGIEDFQAQDPKRTLSAVRNFYAGVLLLGKEVLIRQAPNANRQLLLSTRYSLKPDDHDGVKFVGEGKTIDFGTLGKRLHDFRVPVDRVALRELNRIRNDLEHNFTTLSTSTVRACVAKALPVVRDLFRYGRLDAASLLGDSWPYLLGIREIYEKELEECRQTFSCIRWQADVLEGRAIRCPHCMSDLVALSSAGSCHQHDMECECRACGEAVPPEQAVEATLETLYAAEMYVAGTDGGDPPPYVCPECGVDAYLLTEDRNGCAWCGHRIQSNCDLCGAPLTPDSVSWEGNGGSCGHCAYVMSKDD